MLVHDDVLGQDRVIGSREMLGILFGSFFMIMGSYTYISLKFPDTSVMKYFKQAVKEEIRKRGAEEQQYRLWQVKQRQYLRKQRQKQKVVRSAKKAKMQKEKQKQKPRQQQKQKILVPKTQQVVMSPPGDIAVVKCSKCDRSLKLTSKERPLTIKCPFCQAIGVIKE
jgi:hypothetical protein